MTKHVNKIFRENYDLIKNGSYVWTDEDVENIYELVNRFINKNEVEIKGYTKEDIVQELVMEFFEAVQKYDIQNVHPLTVYLNRVFKQKCLRLEHSNSVEMVCYPSMDQFVEEDAIDFETQLVKSEILKRFIKLNKNKPFVIEYFLDPDMTLQKIGEKNGLTRSRIQQCVAKALRQARTDKVIKKLGSN